MGAAPSPAPSLHRMTRSRLIGVVKVAPTHRDTTRSPASVRSGATLAMAAPAVALRPRPSAATAFQGFQEGLATC